MSTPTPAADSAGAIQAIDLLARRASHHSTLSEPGDEILVRVLRGDERIETLDMEAFAEVPTRPRGASTVHEPASFAAYVTRLRTDATTIWAHREAQNGPRVTAVINDNPEASTAGGGWRDHRVTLAVERDRDWLDWLGLAGRGGVDQLELAEFLEDHLGTIADPPAGQLMGPITEFQVRRDVEFESAVRLSSGATQLVVRETDGGKSTTDVPEILRLRLRPFVGSDPVPIVCRLRWRLRDGKVKFFVQLERPDDAERAAWEFICALIGTGVPEGTPLLQGSAPEPVTRRGR